MEITIRQARKEDALEMLQVYNKFAEQFVGPALRTQRTFKHNLRKGHINWVALDNQNRIIGYVHARINRQFNRGEFTEIVIDPKHDFEQVAKPLVERVCTNLMKRKVPSITAGTLQNPAYERLFPTLEFFESESMGVFMYAILNVQKFLNELLPVFANRLKQIENWKGLIQIECEGRSIFLQKTKNIVQPVVWTSQPVDLKVTPTRELLTKLVFSLANPIESYHAGQLKVETTEKPDETNQLLETLFPTLQFLIMDSW